MDDGCGVPVRVSYDGRAYNSGKFLSVTGVCSCYRGTDTLLHPVLLVRDTDDITGSYDQ